MVKAKEPDLIFLCHYNEKDFGTSSQSSDNNIQVFIRIRPAGTDEPAYSRLAEVSNSETQLKIKQGDTPKVFNFDHVADTDARQETIFEKLGKKVIQNCIAGYNGTIFAYGQTGSGKTFTMMGPSENCNYEHELRGVIPRSFEYLFNLIKEEKEMHGDNKTFLCKCTFLEIYNEQIFDLLEPNPHALQLRESLKTGVYVGGLTERVVVDASEAFQETKAGAEHIRTSKLNLVDLAGSESQKNTNATGLRLKEAGSINKSLSNLGNVIMCLVSVSKDGRERFVPYRDSKLTFLLRASLGGNSKTSLIACIHSGHKFYAETISTLQFAQRAKMIKNKAVLNEDSKITAEQLQFELKKLTEELAQYKSGALIPQEPSTAPLLQGEPTPQLKVMFLRAMTFYQKAQMDKIKMENDIIELKQLNEKTIHTKNLIISFKEKALQRYEARKAGRDQPEKIVETLEQEIKDLRKEVSDPPLVEIYKRELQKLRIEMKMLKSSEECLAKMNFQNEKGRELEQIYKELVAEQKVKENEPLSTPSGNDTISTATVEKLRSQTKDLQEENTMLKRSLADTKEEMDNKVTQLSSDLASSNEEVKTFKSLIDAKETHSKIEMASMKEKHRQAVITITTPKKEKGNTKGGGESPLHSTFFDQIKDQQEVISSLEGRLGKRDREQIENVQTVKMLESRISLKEELLEKEKSKVETLRQDLAEIQKEQTHAGEQISRDAEEISDLRMVLKSADKELKDAKQNYKTVDALRSSEKETFHTQLEKFERSMEQMRKEMEKEFEEKEELKNDLEIQKDNAEFHVSLSLQLEEKLKEKDQEIQERITQLQTVERTLSTHQNRSNQLSLEGMQKEQLYLDECAKNSQLQTEISDLTKRLSTLESEEYEDTRRKLEQALATINQQYSELEYEREKCSQLEKEISSLTEQVEFATVQDVQNQSIVDDLENKEEKFALEKMEQEAKMEKMQAEITSLQELNSELLNQDESHKHQMTSLEKENETLRQENEQFKRMQEQTKFEVGTIEDASIKIKELSEMCFTKTGEIKNLEIFIDTLLKEKTRASSQVTELLYQNQDLKKSEEKQNETISDMMKMLSQSQGDNRSLKLELTNAHQGEEKLNETISDLMKMLSESQGESRSLKLELTNAQQGLEELVQKFEDKNQILHDELSQTRNELRKIHRLFEDEQDPIGTDVDYIHDRIRSMKIENEKLLEENSVLIGHSNHKQKIKYHEQVKNENSQLKRDAALLEVKNRHLLEKINRLEKEKSEPLDDVKENGDNVKEEN